MRGISRYVRELTVLVLAVRRAVEGDLGLFAFMPVVNSNDSTRDLLVVGTVHLCGSSVVLNSDGGRIVEETVDFEGLVVRGVVSDSNGRHVGLGVEVSGVCMT